MWIAWEPTQARWCCIDAEYVPDCHALGIDVREVDILPLECVVVKPDYLSPDYMKPTIDREAAKMFEQIGRFLEAS